MGIKRVISTKEAEKRAKLKDAKDKNKSKGWDALNNNQKFDVIGEYLVSVGFVQP